MGDVDIVGAPYAAGIATDAYPDGLGAQQLLPPSQLGHTDNLARKDIHGLGHRTPRAALQTLIAAENILAAFLLDPVGEPRPLDHFIRGYGSSLSHPPPWIISGGTFYPAPIRDLLHPGGGGPCPPTPLIRCSPPGIVRAPL